MVELENKNPLPIHPAVELLINPIEAVPNAGTPEKFVPPKAVILPNKGEVDEPPTAIPPDLQMLDVLLLPASFIVLAKFQAVVAGAVYVT